MRCIQIKPEL